MNIRYSISASYSLFLRGCSNSMSLINFHLANHYFFFEITYQRECIAKTLKYLVPFIIFMSLVSPYILKIKTFTSLAYNPFSPVLFVYSNANESVQGIKYICAKQIVRYVRGLWYFPRTQAKAYDFLRGPLPEPLTQRFNPQGSGLAQGDTVPW